MFAFFCSEDHLWGFSGGACVHEAPLLIRSTMPGYCMGFWLSSPLKNILYIHDFAGPLFFNITNPALERGM